MSNGDIITPQQLRDLVKIEKLRPEDVFDELALKALRDEARAAGYAEGMFAAVVQKDQVVLKKEVEDDKGLDPHLDPAKNPLIKMG